MLIGNNVYIKKNGSISNPVLASFSLAGSLFAILHLPNKKNKQMVMENWCWSPNKGAQAILAIVASTPINKSVTTPTVTNSPTITPTAVANSAPASQTPAILNPSPVTTTVTQPGMNPPHGQEGHRCDVAVGAALPK